MPKNREHAPLLASKGSINAASSSLYDADEHDDVDAPLLIAGHEHRHHAADADADESSEQSKQFDFVVSMRQIDITRGPVKNLTALDLLMWWCSICGVLPSAASIFTAGGSLDLRCVLTKTYRLFLWLALVFMTLVDVVHAVSREGASWSAVSITILMFLACAASFSLAHDVLRRQTLETRIYQVITNSADPALARSLISFRLITSIVFAVVVSALGVLADVLDSSAFLQDSSSPLSQRLGAGGIFFYRVASIFVQLQVTVGITVITALLGVFQVRVLSAARALTVDEETTSVEQAIRRLIDLDITVSHAAHKYTRDMATVWVSFLLKFLLSAVYQVTSNAKDRFVSREQFGLAAAIDMVIQPGLAALFLLVAVGVLNQEVEYLLKVCARFSLRQRSKPHYDKKLVKELQTYAKNGDFEFRVHGFAVTLSTVWKLVAVCISTYILLLRFKRWGII